MNGDKSLRSRPNLQLAKALRKLGAEIKCCSNDCKPPVWVRGVVKGGKVEIEALKRWAHENNYTTKIDIDMRGENRPEVAGLIVYAVNDVTHLAVA